MTPNKESSSWRRSRKILVLACVVFPPAAVVLVWSRPESGVFGKLAFSLGLAGLFVVHLFAFYGLRAELDGTGSWRFRWDLPGCSWCICSLSTACARNSTARA